VYGLPSAENWPGARSDLKLLYRPAANNTLETHVGSSTGYTFKFVTQSVREYLRSYFFRIASTARRCRSLQIDKDNRGSPIKRVIGFERGYSSRLQAPKDTWISYTFREARLSLVKTILTTIKIITNAQSAFNFIHYIIINRIELINTRYASSYHCSKECDRIIRLQIIRNAIIKR